MLNRKKITCLLGVLILALIIVACGGAADTPTTAPSAPETTPIS